MVDTTPVLTTADPSAPSEPVKAAPRAPAKQATALPGKGAAHAIAKPVNVKLTLPLHLDWPLVVRARATCRDRRWSCSSADLGVPALRRRLRRLARHRLDDPALLATGAWLELLDGLARLGVEVPSSATSSDVAAQVADRFGEDLGPAVELVGTLADQALYSTELPVDPQSARPPGSHSGGSTGPCCIPSRVGTERTPCCSSAPPQDAPLTRAPDERAQMRGRKSATAPAGAVTFPGYANVAELASGAFATVYRAVELGTGRPVALKVLRVADTSPHLVEVFEKELGALALLSNHPNVTTLYGTFSTPEGRPVLVLELCRESLAHRARQNGTLPAKEVVQVGIKIAGALETAHRSGLLHRDMKPQNILVSQFDEPVLADFGVATLQAQAQSTEGVFGFTTLHAPPEALEGLPLSASSDIYGLASSMYQLLVGRGPFSSYEGEAPASVILRILRDPAPRAPAIDVPVALADLIENALAKDPAKRPQSAGAFAETLREIEALAGWAQTPYVVWGAAQAAAPPAEDDAEPPALAAAPNPAAAQLAQLLQAERESLDRLPDPATEATPVASAAGSGRHRGGSTRPASRSGPSGATR